MKAVPTIPFMAEPRTNLSSYSRLCIIFLWSQLLFALRVSVERRLVYKYLTTTGAMDGLKPVLFRVCENEHDGRYRQSTECKNLEYAFSSNVDLANK
jgi:hypothetical protein